MNIQEYKIVKCAGGIVINNKNQIALVFMTDINAWDFPKGGIEKNESAIDAAIREIYEEVGIKKMIKIKELPMYKRVAANGNPVLMHIRMFLFKSTQEKIHPTAKDITEAKWVDKNNIINNLTLEEGKKYFKNIERELQ